MLKVLFIIDEIEHKYFEFNDLVTNFWFIKELLQREYDVHICTKHELYLNGNIALARTQKAYLSHEKGISYLPSFKTFEINDFDVVFFRPDPPVDEIYLNACSIFDFVDRTKTLLINDPSEIKQFGEKFHCAKFPDCTIKSLITASKEVIYDFIAHTQKAVIKPLNMCFGKGVYFLDINDKNLSSLIATATNDFKNQVVLQEYLPQVEQGDKRVLIIANEVLDECIVKLPGENSFKFNTHSDKYFVSSHLTSLERQRANVIAKYLYEHNIYLTGLDMIGEKVSEINITSPCYFIREINNNNNIHFQDKIMQKLENLITQKLSLKL